MSLIGELERARLHGPDVRTINELAAAVELIKKLESERDLAVAHDRQPYPTAEAYETVCKARTAWQARAEEAEAKVKEQSEIIVRLDEINTTCRLIASRQPHSGY